MQIANHVSLKKSAKTARRAMCALAIALTILWWSGPDARANAETTPDASVNSSEAAFIDPGAMKLLEQVQRKLRSIRTISVVCTHTTLQFKGLSPSHTAAFVQTTRARLMRPNLT